MSELAWYQEPRRQQPLSTAFDGRVRVGSPKHTRILLQDLTKTWKERKMAEFAVHDAKIRAQARIELLNELLIGAQDPGIPVWYQAFLDMKVRSELEDFASEFTNCE